MKISSTEKAELRNHWASYKLRFKKDGSIEAQKSPDGAWGILYFPEDTEKHLNVLRNKKE